MMKHRGMIRLLSIAVALLLPLGAMAQGTAMDLLEKAKTDGKEVVTTVTFEPGAELAKDQTVADMSKATALRFLKLPGGYGAFAVALNSVDVLALQMRASEDGIYVQSEILGDKPLYFTVEDLQKGFADLMKNSGMDAQAMAQFNESFNQMMGAGLIMDVKSNENLSEEEIKQKVFAAMGVDDAFIAWVNGIEAKKTVTNGEFTLGDSDKADTKTELTLTADDMVALYDTQYVKDQVAKQLKAADSTMTEEQVDAKTTETLTQVKDEFAKSGFTMPITVYTNGTTDFVAMDMSMSGTFSSGDINTITYSVPVDSADVVVATDDTAAADTTAPEATTAPSVPTKLDVSMQIITKTPENGKNYTFTMNMAQDDKSLFTMNANLNRADQTVNGALAVLDQDGKSVMNLALTGDATDPKHVTGALEGTVSNGDMNSAFSLAMDQVVADTTVDTALSLSYGDSLEAIKADAAKALLGTLNINMTVQDDSGYFAALGKATPDTSLEIMKMSDADLGAYVKTLESNAMQTLYKVMANLPQSVSQALTSTMGN
jgi:hypothetical protein